MVSQKPKMSNNSLILIATCLCLILLVGVVTIIYFQSSFGTMSLDTFLNKKFDTSQYKINKVPTQQERDTMIVPGNTNRIK